MEIGNKIIEEISKSGNDIKIEPTKNIIFSQKEKKLINKNIFTNIILKKKLEQNKDNNRNFIKSLIENNKNNNITKFYKSRNIYINKEINAIKLDEKISELFQKENEINNNNLNNYNKKFYIINELNHGSIINRKRNRNNSKIFFPNSLSLNKINTKKKLEPIDINKMPFISKIAKEIIKLKNEKIIKNENKNNINKSIGVEVRLLNLNLSKLDEPKTLKQSHSINNDTIILSKKNSDNTINFSSAENKNNYLFGKRKKKNLNILEKFYNYENKIKTLYNLKNFFEKNKTKNISKSDKIIRNIDDKVNSNSSIFVNNKNKSFSESSKNYNNDNEKINISEKMYNKISINNIHIRNNNKFNFLRINEVKDNCISEINFLKEIEDKSKSVMNKKNLIIEQYKIN